jgi:peptidoglycan/LPS O-acetylase OafA/YrhL
VNPLNNNLGELFETRGNNFNLIRLLAAASVIYGHAGVVVGSLEPDFFLRSVGYKFIGGVAVDVFFVLSGFLIAASAESGQGLRYFCASRLLRIYPALLVCLTLSIVTLGALYAGGFEFWSASTWRYFWVNASTVNTEYFLPGIFTDRPDNAINGSLWSIPVEVRMYVLVALLSILGVLARRALFNLVFFSCALLLYFHPEKFSPLLLHPSHLHVVGMFGIGVFYWVNRRGIPLSPWVLFMLLLIAGALHGTPKFGFAYVMVLPYLVWSLAFFPGFLWFNKMGDYSYGVYLYGWPVQQVVAASFPSMNALQNTFFAIAASLVLAVLSWHLVERPSLRMKSRFKSGSVSERSA